MTSNFDTNISSYTLSELMAISEINEMTPDEILIKTNKLIDKFKKTNPQISVFFKEVQSQLLQYAQGLIDDSDDESKVNKIVVESFGNMSKEAIFPAGDKQITDWYKNEALSQSNKNQQDKITDRKQKIQIFGNQHVNMKRDQLATTDTYQLPVKQDSLNPNLKNTITRFVNLDSQFRQYTSGIESTSTDYTLDLSDTLKDVISLSLYSYQIPYNFYTIDSAYGNTCLWIIDGSGNTVAISVPPGNYLPAEFITALTLAFNTAGFSAYPPNGPVIYNSNNGKITIYLNGASFTGKTIDDIIVSFTVNTSTIITFFDFTGVLQCNTNCYAKSSHYLNSTLGWIMGFRVPYINVDASGNIGSAVLDLNGTKYLILVIDDFNQNHVNNNLVSITQLSNTLKMPSYYSSDIPYTCLPAAPQGNNLQQLITESNIQSLFTNQASTTSNGLLLAGKYESSYSPTQIVLPSGPRTLTQSQLYTINEINRNRNNNTNYLSKAPTSADILAVIPFKPSTSTGTLLVEFSGSLQDNIRTYFGPVNIDRMCVKLLDDKGIVINLNSTDWCVTLICTCLYQY